MQFSYETMTLNNIVTAARGGVIHSNLITPSQMSKTLRDIQHRLKQSLQIPMGTRSSELYELQKITKMTVFYSDNKIVFITKIPLVTDTELTLYNMIPIPIKSPNSDNYYIMAIEYTYVAITKDRRHFTTYRTEQIDQCKETAIYQICPTKQPIQGYGENQPCEVDLFNKQDGFPIKCEPKLISIKRNIYHKLKFQNAWIF